MTVSTLGGPQQVTAWDGAEVATFDMDRDDILVVQRPPVPGIADAIQSVCALSCRYTVTEAVAEVHASEALGALRIVHPVLAADIVGLSRSFLGQFDVDEASLRVEVVDKQSCPDFHCDNVRVRLVTTYYGPTTEYVRIDSPKDVQVAPLFALVFLKGQKHRTHGDAVHHRSPDVPPGSKRLCVVLDF
ncbi:MAG: DUF1826 domain-containing protein [Planctomycetes bacterium]|nr:DUF1826 domain-containing protein [Planctomycetota bacterium]